MPKLLKWIFLAFLSFGCSVGPSYRPPIVETPSEWKHSAGFCQSCNDFSEVNLLNWWEIFEDSQLSWLENQVLENNKNIFIAWERIQESRALMGIAAADLYPQITLNPQYTSTGELIQVFGQASSVASNSAGSILRVHELLYFLPFNMRYEVDLWGKIRDQYAYANYHWQAQIKDYETVLLTMTTDLATAYYQLRAADAQIDLLEKTLKTRQKAYEINESRYEGMVTFYADVTLAGEEVDSVLEQYYEVLRQRDILEDRIAVLMGIPASNLCLPKMPLIGIPPHVPGGIPSEILLRRPDIEELELGMRAQHALIKEAYAQFFPSLVLTGVEGFESPILKLFLRSFSRYWMFGVMANQIIFDGFRTYSNLQLQIATFKEASETYQQQVLVAFQEVEDALTSIDYYAKEFAAAEGASKWALKSYQLYLDRYESGVTYYIDVVNTERDLLEFEITLNQVRGFRYIATIQLIKALGGSW